METELAKHQEFNARNEDIKEQQDSSLCAEKRKKKTKAIYKHRLSMLMPFTILMFASFFVYIITINPIIVLVYNGSVFLCCLLLLIYGNCIYKASLKQYINSLFGIPLPSHANGDGIFHFEERHYAGLWLLVIIIYTTLVSIFASIYHVVNETTWIPLTVFTRVSALLMNALLLIIFYKTEQCHPDVMVTKQSLFEKHKNVQQIDDKIHQRLKEWRDMKRFANRRKEYAAICFGVCCVSLPPAFYFGVLGGWNNDWSDSNYHDWNIFFVIIYLIDVPVFSSVLYFLRTISLHYKLGFIIMDELSFAINAESTADLIGWWQLREFYANCIVNRYTPSSSSLTTLSLVAVALLSMGLLYYLFAYGTIFWEILPWLFFVFLESFLFVSNAVKYLAKQLSHTKMINKEAMKLEINKWETSDTRKDIEYQLYHIQMQHQHYIICRMREDIERNSVAISVFGIKMNHTFMSLLKTAAGSIVVAVVSAILRR
eukprot:227157_1